jgi:hypothetical protein
MARYRSATELSLEEGFSTLVLETENDAGVSKKEPAARAGAGQSKSIPEEASPQSKRKNKS